MIRLAILSMLILTGCTDAESTIDTVQKQGFTNVVVDGYSPFSCGNDDKMSTGFTATNPKGDVVSGVVCCGWFIKGCTVRW